MSCGNAWTSMKGRVTFWIKAPQTQSHQQNGIVCFKLFGQKCQKCKPDSHFEHAMWYPQEALKVCRIPKIFYSFLRL